MMEMIEYRGVVDKSHWPRGEWDDEPDKVQWLDEGTGLPCLIVRGPVGALCGYVGVSPAHPWHGKDCDACEPLASDEDGYGYVDVHGGLTFAGGCQHSADPSRGICHVPGPGEPDDIWWLGFDCAHSGDVCPPCSDRGYVSGYESYRHIGYVRREVEKLAKQAAALSPLPGSATRPTAEATTATDDAAPSVANLEQSDG